MLVKFKIDSIFVETVFRHILFEKFRYSLIPCFYSEDWSYFHYSFVNLSKLIVNHCQNLQIIVIRNCGGTV